MSGVKHTPGPWVSLGSFVITEAEVSINRTHGYGCGNDFICDLNDGEYHEYTSQTEQEANARLIAAAPDLLEALTEARLTLSLTRTNIMVEMKKSEGTAYRWEGVPEALQARIVQCDDAIARARGEQDGGGE